MRLVSNKRGCRQFSNPFHQMRTQEEVTDYEPGNGFHPTMLALDVGLARLQHYEKKILLLIGGPDCGILL